MALSPHTDDVELACGGTLAKWVESGYNIIVVAFSATHEREKLSTEFKNALQVLSIKQFKIYKYKTRYFFKDRQKILEDMVKLERQYKPDIVLCPNSEDTHQDHAVIREEAFRAFKKHSILGYDSLQNSKSFQADLFVTLEDQHIDSKIRAIQCYESQRNRIYVDKEIIRGACRLRGAQIGKPLAEAFEVIRMVL